VDGSDQGGISKAMNWTGGGGFKVYKLAESLLEYDVHGILTLNPDFTDEMVAEAVAKIEGYKYNPRPAQFWQQAEGLDKSYLYVTKVFISRQWLDQLVAQIPTDVSLLICCPAYTEGCEKAYKHIKLKKIPQAFQDAYAFDKNDYSLHVENVMLTEEETLENDENTEGVVKKGGKKVKDTQATLF
jgi:adenine-specific DNA-methyltransferase